MQHVVQNNQITIDNVTLYFDKNKKLGKDSFLNDLKGSATRNWNNTNKISWYYQRWRCMRTRVNKSKGCITVSSEWKIFSNFLVDIINMENVNKENFHLDKDLLSNNSLRHYSKETCVLIPAALNRALALDIESKEKKQILKRYKNYYKKDLCLKSHHALERYINSL